MRNADSCILVTGADGFIGGALCDALTNGGFMVRRAVRAHGGHARASDTYIIGDIEKYTDWHVLTAGAKAIVHLANVAHRPKRLSGAGAERIRSINVGATLKLAAAAARNGVGRFVYVSSAHVNGLTTTERPFVETDAAAPSEPYGVSKWEAEQELRRLEQSSQLQVTIIRPPLVYGPHVKGNFLRLLYLVKSGWPLPLGSVQNLRSLVAVQNLADLLVCCVDHPLAGGAMFFVSDGHDISTPDLIRLLATAIGRRARLIRCPLGWLRVLAACVGERASFERISESLQVDSSRAREVLGWRPPITMEEGLDRMVAWFKHDGK